MKSKIISLKEMVKAFPVTSPQPTSVGRAKYVKGRDVVVLDMLPGRYTVDLYLCQTESEILDWIMHLHEKDRTIIPDFLDVLNAAFVHKYGSVVVGRFSKTSNSRG